MTPPPASPSDDDGTGLHNERPVLRVVSGNPTPDELAAILAVVAARGGASAPQRPHFSLWARKSRLTRPVQRPGFGAWRASMMPR